MQGFWASHPDFPKEISGSAEDIQQFRTQRQVKKKIKFKRDSPDFDPSSALLSEPTSRSNNRLARQQRGFKTKPQEDKAPTPSVCTFWGFHQSCSFTTNLSSFISKSTDLILRPARLRQEQICSVIPAVLAECTRKAPSARLAREE